MVVFQDGVGSMSWRLKDLEMLDRLFPGNRDMSGKHQQWDEVFIRVAPPEKQ
jgi:hypothetical protein